MRRRVRRGVRIRPDVWKRVAVYGLLLLILGAAMCSFFAQLTRLPATPDLILGAVLAIALLDGRKTAAIVGVFGGIVIDSLGGVGVSLSPLLYLVVVLTVGGISEKMLPGFFSWLCLLLPSLLLRGLFTALGFLFYTGGLPVGEVLRSVILPEAICTVIFCCPLYFLVKLCVLPIKDRRDRAAR